MPHYKAGTATLVQGSAIVTGAGCNWMSPNVYPGDVFWTVDDRPYEIVEILSATQLRLARGYLGANAPAQPYFVAPTQSHEGDLALRAASLIDDIATATETIGAGAFPGGTAEQPGVRFIDDPATGLTNPAPDVLGVVVGGVEIAKFDMANGVAQLKGRTTIGATPGDITYEMSSGGQPALVPPHLQIADVFGRAITLSMPKWGGGPKPLTIQAGVNRGSGMPGPGYGLKTIAGDRLFSLAIYGGKDSDGTTTSHAHAGYLTWTAEADNDGGNEQDASYHLKPGVATRRSMNGAGNGVQGNSRMQTAFPGPNRTQFAPADDYGGNVYIGPGSLASPAMKFDVGPLTDVAAAGALESDPIGHLHRTTTDGHRRQLLAARSVGLTAPPVNSAFGTTTFRRGPNWAEITLTPAADFTAPNGATIVSMAIAPALDVVPPVHGSMTSSDVNNQWPRVGYASKAGRITIGLAPGETIRAGIVYVFTISWFLP